eukprot:TRINITY_DN24115_c0_g1_i1.p1 TRINITY_DN24115_c0_g1~~TRINITY_DN24115_c0_g1_i1.p1  ORF type:complete len:139 (+),score=25.57 TRINITY_DN24115_c0_g1_i1:212-628(+)
MHRQSGRVEDMLESDLKEDTDEVADISDEDLSAPGAPWTEEEALAIMSKLYVIGKMRPFTRDKMHEKIECYADAPDANLSNPSVVPCSYWDNRWHHQGVQPSFPMMLRFGFHQCFKYRDGKGGGCNGRNPVSHSALKA